MSRCIFDKAWQGQCENEAVPGETFCEGHLLVVGEDKTTGTYCVVCGNQATRECEWASSLVCGAPLCDNPECREAHWRKVH